MYICNTPCDWRQVHGICKLHGDSRWSPPVPTNSTTLLGCLASPANFIYGRVEAKVLSHVTFMPMLLRPVNNFLGQVIGNASQGKYNTVNNSSSGEVTFQKCMNSGITLFPSKISNKSQTFATGAYQRLHEARPRRVVWLWEPEYLGTCLVLWGRRMSTH